MQRRTGLRRARIRRVGAIDFSSGVAAGTYGDSTHVGQFTVDDIGRITDASNIPIALSAANLQPIAAQSVIGNLTAAPAAPSVGSMAQLRESLAMRAEMWRIAQGCIAETAPHYTCSLNSSAAGSTMTSGIVYLAQVFLLAGDVLTKTHIQSALLSGGTQTAGYVSLYSGSVIQLASTGNTGNLWSTSLGLHSTSLSTPYTVPTTGIYYASVLAVFTGAGPNLLLTGPTGEGYGVSPQGFFYVYRHNGVVAAPPASLSPTLVGANISPWVAFS